jgi:hypothetical protein
VSDAVLEGFGPDNSAILDKIRKLLAKAEDPGCTPAEASALTDKAATLIAKYGVDRALLAASRPESDQLGDRMIHVPPPYSLDKAGLLSQVAVSLRCRTVRQRSHTDTSAYTMHLFGFASDLERVELLYTSLLVQASYALGATPVPFDESPAAFRRSWLAGFAQAVGRRLREAERRATQEPRAPRPDGPSLALVLADRSNLVDRRVDAVYPALRSAGPRRLGGSGMGHGYSAGQRADLGGAQVVRHGRPSLTR